MKEAISSQQSAPSGEKVELTARGSRWGCIGCGTTFKTYAEFRAHMHLLLYNLPGKCEPRSGRRQA